MPYPYGYTSCDDALPNRSGWYKTVVVDNAIGRGYQSESLFLLGDGWETDSTYMDVRAWKSITSE